MLPILVIPPLLFFASVTVMLVLGYTMILISKIVQMLKK